MARKTSWCSPPTSRRNTRRTIMLDSFDSRALRLTDCYGQRFMKVGTFRYHVLPAGADCIVDERPFVVNVVETRGKGEMNQHDVSVRADGAVFKADPPEVTIEA